MAGPGGDRLVGRAVALGQLTGLLDVARRGLGGAGILLGEPGIGKTRLLEELATTAAAEGFRVLWARCSELAMEDVRHPWDQLFAAVGAGDAAAATRDAVAAAVIDRLSSSAEDQPTLLCVEDLHWASADSRWVLRAVADATAGRGLLLLGTSRPDPALTELPPRVRRVELGALTELESAELAEQVAPSELSDELRTDVTRQAGGNPLFIRELVLARLAGAGARVPGGVRDVLVARLARLPSRTVDALAAAAALGIAARLGDVAALLGHPEEEAVQALEPAERAGLVRLSGSGLELVHAVVRDVLLEQVGARQRSDLLARAAARAEQLGAPPAELVARWAAVTRPDADDRVLIHARRALAQARQARSPQEALRFAREAAARSSDPADQLALGECLARAGDMAAARPHLLGLARQRLAASDPELAVHALLGLSAGESGFEIAVGDVEQAELLRSAVAALPPGAARARGQARLTVLDAMSRPLEERIVTVRGALAEAEQAGSTPALLEALAAYADAIAGPRHVEERLQVTARMLRLAEESGSVDGRLLAQRMMLVAQLEAGDFNWARATAAAFEQLAGLTKEPAHQWYPPLWQGMFALLEGRPADARLFAAEVERRGEAAQSGNARILAATLLLAAREDDRQAAAALAGMEEYVESTGTSWTLSALAVRAAIAGLVGDLDGAAADLDRIHAQGLETLPEDAEHLSSLLGVAEAALLTGHVEVASAALTMLTPYAGIWIVDGIGAACVGLVEEWLGRLERMLGMAAEAATHEGAAREAYRACGAVGPLRRMQGVGGSGSTAAVLRPAEGGWRVGWGDRSVLLPDLKGLRDLAYLLGRPGQPVPAAALLASTAGVPVPMSAGADVLDARARAAYRDRLRTLEDDIAAAESAGDADRADRASSERTFLIRELSSALGLGGRSRRIGDEVDRARKAVTMRLREAIRRAGEGLPELGEHLQQSVRTGRHCSYEPAEPVEWALG